MSRRKRIPPAAFMSYVREDDRYGHLTELRERLEHEVGTQIGEPFTIFQDRMDILWGQNWKLRVDDAVDSVTFLLPIITPRFFRSSPCREELQRFVDREAALGRTDLILPIYYVDTPLLNDNAQREADVLAGVVASRQYVDWRPWRFEPHSSKEVGKSLEKLASQIRDALERVSKGESGGSRPRRSGSRRSSRSPAAQAETVSDAREERGDQRISGIQAHNDPPTRIVDPLHRGDHATITEAIRAADPGDRILVRPGYYQEALVLDKPLEIIGEGDLTEIVVHASGGHALLFQTTLGRVTNLTFRQGAGRKYHCIKITQGRLELEGCDISSDSLACIAILNHADPRLRRNRIHGGREGGVFVLSNGRGTLEDNDIFGNAFAGVEIKDGGDPTLRHNRIHGGFQGGVYIHSHGKGTFEDNEIFGNASAGVTIKSEGDPTLRRNRIHGNRQAGVLVYENGRGRLEENDIYANTYAGIHSKTGSHPLVRSNRINRNGYEAICVYEGGGGTFEANDLRENGRGAWDIAADSAGSVTRRDNEES